MHHASLRLLLLWPLLLPLTVLQACAPDEAVLAPCMACGCAPEDFAPHTRRSFDRQAEIASFCDTGAGSVACKFVIPVFDPAMHDPRLVRYADVRGGVEWMSPRFYDLHDEWYWYHMLNGAPIDGCRELPVQGLHFDSVQAIYTAYKGVTEGLPLDLRWSGSRLYSERFYLRILAACETCGHKTECWNTCPREMGGGTLTWYPADPDRPVPEAFWAFHLYLDDEVKRWELERFFTRLRASLPPDVAADLRWVARAQPYQEGLVDAIRAEGGPLADKVHKAAEVITPGAVSVYNPGVAVGRVRRVGASGTGIASLRSDDIVVLQAVPDELPPVAAILTAEPQTPQAHINLLAKARGTPNAFVQGIYDDPIIQEWSVPNWNGGRQWLALQVRDGVVRYHPMSDAELKTWNDMTSTVPVQVPMADLSAAPLTVPLDQGGLKGKKDAIALGGGKCAGLMGLFDFPALEKPFAPLCLTVAGYDQHIEPIKPLINAMQLASGFAQEGRLRYLLLEGKAAFEKAHQNDGKALAWLIGWWKNDYPHVTPAIRQILDGGGIVGLIEDRAVDPTWLGTVRTALAKRFAPLAQTQGLRFRSSATVEDIEGFNGAGVYDSNTGFLFPKAQSDPNDKKKTIDRAIKRTWSSYWRYAAFEERRIAHIDHTTGRMAVLVHPRFDDALEAANGVVLASIARRQDGQLRLTTEVNVQKGDLSVTNPPPGSGASPEVDRVVQEPGGAATVERVQSSSETPLGAFLLTQEQLLWMHTQLQQVAKQWLEVSNLGLSPPERRLTLVLDLEFRQMKAGWPAMTEGGPLPARIVFKQARTLMADHGVKASDLGAVKAPLDLIAAAVDARRRTCTTAQFTFETVELRTADGVDVYPHQIKPFDARIRLTFPQGLPALSIPAGAVQTADHTQWAQVKHPQTDATHWDIDVSLGPTLTEKWGYARVQLADSGVWRLGEGDLQVSGQDAKCQGESLKLSSTAWIESLFIK